MGSYSIDADPEVNFRHDPVLYVIQKSYFPGIGKGQVLGQFLQVW